MGQTVVLVGALSVWMAAAAADPRQEAKPTDKRSALAKEGRAVIRVRLPAADAKVWFEGEGTLQTGKEREFVSPRLEAGATHTYTVKASWFKEGKEITREKQVSVRPGAETVVEFSDQDEAPKPESMRKRRLNRWDIRFEYNDGADYARQLEALEAMIAVPDEDRYRLYRDLSRRPAEAESVSQDDLRKLNRIYWVNRDPEAVQLLLEALGIPKGPDRFWAFFPADFEQDLVKKEIAYANRPEEEIAQTVFRVKRRAGKWVVEVESQQGRSPK